jgi:hypothetical protein
MDRTPLDSSMLKSAAHDGDSTLEVEFHGGGLYRYTGVPRDLYNALRAAKSAGQFFGRHIRGKYPHQKAAAAVEDAPRG